uniref:Protein HTATIP2 n=1 Tax=Trichobilharzia regenti TaxID=157069 RepID=A0AA85KJ95_TRIRE|nr:unnamed protein product [Trichobilharzia regenti]
MLVVKDYEHSSTFPVNSYHQSKYFWKIMVSLRAFVVGCTGETGKALIKALAKDSRYSSVKLIQRRETEVDYGSEATEIENRFTQIVIDFDRLDDYKEVFQGTDIGFCALGTTLKKSGKEKMKVIDHDYVIRIAELSSAAGCKEFHLVSSKGANKASSFFYLQLKGEIESDLISLNLFSKCLAIYRPGTLLCSRVESRPVERVFQLLLKPVAYMAPTLLTTPVDTLAQAMARAPFSAKLNSDSPTQTEKSLPKNIHILENHDIFSLAKDDGSA